MQYLKNNQLKAINKLVFQFIEQKVNQFSDQQRFFQFIEKQNEYTIDLINNSNSLENFDFNIFSTNNVFSISNILFVIRLSIIEQFSSTSFFINMSKTKFIEQQ